MSLTEMLLLSNTILLLCLVILLTRIVTKLDQGLFDLTAPVNQYGESFTDAIQNSLVRGQRGIATWNE